MQVVMKQMSDIAMLSPSPLDPAEAVDGFLDAVGLDGQCGAEVHVAVRTEPAAGHEHHRRLIEHARDEIHRVVTARAAAPDEKARRWTRGRDADGAQAIAKHI